MSLLNKATLITTPTAHSNGTLHSIKGGAVADFDVVRGSAATRVNAEGLIESVATNIPRIDYTTGEGVVLLEPQSTNLVTHSDDFSNASWQKQQSGISTIPTVTSNFSISPSGIQDADRVIFNLNGGTTSNDFSQITLGTAVYTGDATNYVYIKSNTNDSKD